MALRGNFSVLNKTPGKHLAGGSTAATNQAQCRSNWNRPSDWRKFSLQDRSGGTGDIAPLQLAGKPYGYYPPGSWALPTKAGAISTYQNVISLTAAGSGALGRNIEGSTTLAVTVAGTGQLVVSGVGSFTASLTVSGNIIATRAAVGEFTATLSTNTPTLTAKGHMTGSAALSMSVSATRYATGALEGDFSPSNEFSPDNLAAAVWNALTADYGESGTFGEAMAAAGSAGDPWSTTLPGSYTGSQAGYLMYVMQQILRNKTKTDPATGIMTVYADDNSTVLFTANVFNDADGSTAYDGTAGINRRDRLA